VKHRFVVLAAVAVVGVSAVATSATAAPARQASMDQTIVQVAAGSPSFSTLVSLVKKAGLVGTLSGTGPFTVFAPTNAAFKAVPAKILAALAKPANKKLLATVLTYHVLSGEVKSGAALAAAKAGKSVSTVEGEKIKLSVKGGSIWLNGSAKVVKADVLASNGVIHVINKVILPPSVVAKLKTLGLL